MQEFKNSEKINSSNENIFDVSTAKKKQKFFIINKIKKLTKWSIEEDEILIKLAIKFKQKCWVKISKIFQNKSPSQCRARYRRIRPGIVKGHWRQEEDDLIISLVKKYGKNWAQISNSMHTRNGKQIRDRFLNYLDPNIKKDGFTSEEDKKIILLYKDFGPKWSFISQNLEGRTSDIIKNRFHSYLKRKIHLNEISKVRKKIKKSLKLKNRKGKIKSSKLKERRIEKGKCLEKSEDFKNNENIKMLKNSDLNNKYVENKNLLNTLNIEIKEKHNLQKNIVAENKDTNRNITLENTSNNLKCFNKQRFFINEQIEEFNKTMEIKENKPFKKNSTIYNISDPLNKNNLLNENIENPNKIVLNEINKKSKTDTLIKHKRKFPHDIFMVDNKQEEKKRSFLKFKFIEENSKRNALSEKNQYLEDLNLAKNKRKFFESYKYEDNENNEKNMKENAIKQKLNLNENLENFIFDSYKKPTSELDMANNIYDLKKLIFFENNDLDFDHNINYFEDINNHENIGRDLFDPSILSGLAQQNNSNINSCPISHFNNDIKKNSNRILTNQFANSPFYNIQETNSLNNISSNVFQDGKFNSNKSNLNIDFSQCPLYTHLKKLESTENTNNSNNYIKQYLFNLIFKKALANDEGLNNKQCENYQNLARIINYSQDDHNVDFSKMNDNIKKK